MKIVRHALVFLSFVSLFSCQTIGKDIPADATAEIYFQKAQAATDLNQFDVALEIFQRFLATNSQEDAVFHRLGAQYEIGLLHFKQGNFKQASQDFQAILDLYKDVATSANYPAWIKVLSQKKLQEITDQTAPKL